jgi:hypothetical protein
MDDDVLPIAAHIKQPPDGCPTVSSRCAWRSCDGAQRRRAGSALRLRSTTRQCRRGIQGAVTADGTSLSASSSRPWAWIVATGSTIFDEHLYRLADESTVAAATSNEPSAKCATRRAVREPCSAIQQPRTGSSIRSIYVTPRVSSCLARSLEIPKFRFRTRQNRVFSEGYFASHYFAVSGLGRGTAECAFGRPVRRGKPGRALPRVWLIGRIREIWAAGTLTRSDPSACISATVASISRA